MTVTKPKKLSDVESGKLARADRQAVVAALSRSVLHQSGEWLDPTNPYRVSAGAKVEADGRAVPPSDQAEFAEYLAAAAFGHCGDAWSYLGRALDALLKGDIHGAVHLTYYAELRSALGLLSAEGIYIGDKVSLVVTSSGAVQSVGIPNGTHIAAWRCLDAWSRTPAASTLMGRVVRPVGATLDEWASGLPGGSIEPVLQELFSSVAFDLDSFSDDRERRNHVSYQPTRIIVDDLPSQRIADLVQAVWTVVEPDGRGTFPVMDQNLLRQVLVGTYSPTHQKLDVQGELTGDVDWDAWGAWLRTVAPSSALGSRYLTDLAERPVGDPRDHPLEHAFIRSTIEQTSSYITEMVLRTAILLRLTTGACNNLLDDSGIGWSATHPWVESIGASRGLWAVSDRPHSMADLWIDTFEALRAIERTGHPSQHDLLKQLDEHLTVLTQGERVLAWSFAS